MNSKFAIIFALALVASASAQTPGRVLGGGICSVKNGYYPVGGQCDAYIQCIDGVPEERLCPDGLLYNEELGPHAYPCQYPNEVQCKARSALQPARPTERCPHQYAYYRNGDSRNCGRFVNCAGGIAYDFECPEGLAWNEATYRCDWPDQVADCDAEAFLGFSCPNLAKSSELGPPEEGRFYRSTSDCVHYYACINGRPRMFRCGKDQGFNVETNQCEDIANVTGCAIPESVAYSRQQQPQQQQQQRQLPQQRNVQRQPQFQVQRQAQRYTQAPLQTQKLANPSFDPRFSNF